MSSSASTIRPATFLALFCLVLASIVLILISQGRQSASADVEARAMHDTLTSQLGLTDLCLATEARYTRHPALTDDLAPFMDYPQALDYFPSGLFWAPP